MARRTRHFIKALLALSVLVVIMLLVQIGADQRIVPSWDVLLTQPISSWSKVLDSENKTREVNVKSITDAPSVQEPIPPMRVANHPVSGNSQLDTSADQTRKAERIEKFRPEESSRTSREGLESSLLAMGRPPKDVPETHGTGPSGGSPSETVDPAETDADPAVAEKELAQLMAIGGEKMREGFSLPCLIAAWEFEDLQKLACEGYGYIVVKWRGQFFVVFPKGESFLDADEFVPLIKETKAKMSNRGIDLNRKSQGKNYRDTPIRPALKALEERFVARIGGEAKGEIPVFTFFPSTSFEAYLSRKQLGVLAAMGFNPQDPKWDKKAVSTIGTLALTARRPVYVIDAVQVGSEMHPWKDPEKGLLSRKS